MPTYLNALNNAILRANLPSSRGNRAAYGERGGGWGEKRALVGQAEGDSQALMLDSLSLPPRHHPDQPSHEQDQRQPFSGLPVGVVLIYLLVCLSYWLVSALLLRMFS